MFMGFQFYSSEEWICLLQLFNLKYFWLSKWRNKNNKTNWNISFALFIFWLYSTSFDLKSHRKKSYIYIYIYTCVCVCVCVKKQNEIDR